MFIGLHEVGVAGVAGPVHAISSAIGRDDDPLDPAVIGVDCDHAHGCGADTELSCQFRSQLEPLAAKALSFAFEEARKCVPAARVTYARGRIRTRPSSLCGRPG